MAGRYNYPEQPALSWTSSSVDLITLMSRLTRSIHLCFSPPLSPPPGGTISSICIPTVLATPLQMSKPPYSSFPVLLCDVLYLQCLPDVITPDVVSSCVIPCPSTHLHLYHFNSLTIIRENYRKTTEVV